MSAPPSSAEKTAPSTEALPPDMTQAAPGGNNNPTDTDIASLLEVSAPDVWYRRSMVWAGVVLTLVLVASFFYWQVQRAANAQPSYTTQAVTRGNLTLTVTANGTIQPTRSISIGSELSGAVRKVNVDVNDVIKKGQVLVELDTSKLQDQVLRSKAALAAAIAKVSQTEATKKEAAATLQRLQAVAQLSGGKVPSKTELDSGLATYDRAVADDLSARAGVNDARAALSTDQINISKASISAPADGIVLTRTVDPGNAVAASLQAVTLFTVAEDLAKLRLWVYVDEADVGTVKIGQYATFTVSAYPSRNFPARITRVGFGSTITDNVVTYLTYLDVDNADLSLRPGMTATATITAQQRHNVLRVPNSALRFSPNVAETESSKKTGMAASLLPKMPNSITRKSAASNASTAMATQVWVLPKNGKGIAVPVAVKPGISDGRIAEIMSGNLELGMQVITDQRALAE